MFMLVQLCCMLDLMLRKVQLELYLLLAIYKDYCQNCSEMQQLRYTVKLYLMFIIDEW